MNLPEEVISAASERSEAALDRVIRRVKERLPDVRGFNYDTHNEVGIIGRAAEFFRDVPERELSVEVNGWVRGGSLLLRAEVCRAGGFSVAAVPEAALSLDSGRAAVERSVHLFLDDVESMLDSSVPLICRELE